MSLPALFDMALAALVLTVGLWVILARTAFAATVGFVACGLLLTLAWFRLGAPDVAMTEAAIGGGVTGALLIGAASRRSAGGEDRDRPGMPARIVIAMLCAMVAAGIAAAVLALPDPAPTLAPEAAAALPATGVGNPVTAVLMAFRALDTLLEMAVLVLALLAVWSLAPDGAWGGAPGTMLPPAAEPLVFLARLLPPVGIVVGTITLTGVATTFGTFVVSAGEKLLLLSLVLTMVTCLLLGMGIPTIPNYIITSSLAAPALLHLGVPRIVGHMFVFYFGILADLTPPVALACFAAAPIARESGRKISLQAVKIATAGFVVPFMAVYTPSLMLQDGGPLSQSMGYAVAVAYIVAKTLLAIALWGSAIVGFLHIPMRAYERLLAAAAAAMLIVALPLPDEIGFALAVLCFAIHWRRSHVAARAPRSSPA